MPQCVGTASNVKMHDFKIWKAVALSFQILILVICNWFGSGENEYQRHAMGDGVITSTGRLHKHNVLWHQQQSQGDVCGMVCVGDSWSELKEMSVN